MVNPVSQEQFDNYMEGIGLCGLRNRPIAIAVSGGADSMALTHLLHQWLGVEGRDNVHILTVDHGLRPESADEVKMVQKFAKDSGVKCRTFKWLAEKSEKSIQERARQARYGLMSAYCQSQKIGHLFLAHHGDDQMETFLFRLAKGSGIEGLACMKPVQKFGEQLSLIRPLLTVSHANLIETCRQAGIVWVEDLSNDSEKYMRGRMRRSRAILEQEGLSVKRISQLTARIERAGSLIDQIVENKEKTIIVKKDTKRIDIKLSELVSEHSEVIIRILQRSIARLRIGENYPARLEDVERLALRLTQDGFRGATLGGVKFTPRSKEDILCLTLEQSQKT